jgi:hypothetical protein
MCHRRHALGGGPSRAVPWIGAGLAPDPRGQRHPGPTQRSESAERRRERSRPRGATGGGQLVAQLRGRGLPVAGRHAPSPDPDLVGALVAVESREEWRWRQLARGEEREGAQD